MRSPRFFLLVVAALAAVGVLPASPAGAASGERAPAPSPAPARASSAARPSSTAARPADGAAPSAAEVAIAGSAMTLLSPADAIARALSALDATLGRRLLAPIRMPADGTVACPVPDRIEVVDNFGEWRGSHRHTGVDIRAPHGAPVRAVLPGTVESAGVDGAYGLTVTLRDLTGDLWLYAHLSSITVEAGQGVRPGRALGRAGCTGRCSGPHLHLERRPQGGAPVDTYDRLVAACGSGLSPA